MLVVDTNIIAYFYLASEFTPLTERLIECDPQWVAPILWRSELRNVLALYMRAKRITLDRACAIQEQAEWLMEGSEHTSDSLEVLKLANHSGISAYDCEFVSLAQRLGVPLVTTDKKLLRSFPAIAVSLDAAAG